MIRLAIAAHAIDLGTFLLAAPLLVGYELGPIGVAYAAGGVLLAVAYKAAGLSLVFSLARISRRAWIVPIAAWAGVIGAAFNTYALWQIKEVL